MSDNFYGTVYGDPDPYYDGCSNHSNPTVKMSGTVPGSAVTARRWAASRSAAVTASGCRSCSFVPCLLGPATGEPAQ